jgi:hypothetical protein
MRQEGDDFPPPSFFIGNSFIGSGGLANVYEGLGPDGQRIAIKLAEKDDCKRLEQEWKVYVALSRKGLDGQVIPRCLGYFVHKNFSTLVTEYAGESVPEAVDLEDKDR